MAIRNESSIKEPSRKSEDPFRMSSLFQQGRRNITFDLLAVLCEGNLSPFLTVVPGFFFNNRYLRTVFQCGADIRVRGSIASNLSDPAGRTAG